MVFVVSQISDVIRDVAGEDSAECASPAPLIGWGWAPAGVEHERFDSVVARRVRTGEFLEETAGLVECYVPEPGVEVRHRSRGAADDGAVGVRAACGLLAILVETFAMEVRREDAGLHILVRLSTVGGKEWL